LHNNLLTYIRRYYKQHNQPGYELCNGLEVQHQYPLDKLLFSPVNTEVRKHHIYTSFQLAEHSFPQAGPLLTDYYFEAILLSGDLMGEIQEQSQQSELFSFRQPVIKEVIFEFPLPHNQPWMLLLKAACFESNQRATNPKYYAMKVIATGDGKQ
jgi:hypothetical protein